jgi:hypothetical protein
MWAGFFGAPSMLSFEIYVAPFVPKIGVRARVRRSIIIVSGVCRHVVVELVRVTSHLCFGGASRWL